MLVNSKEMLKKAKENGYAVPQFNINNLEWTKYILEEAESLQKDIILGVSEGAVKYFGGYGAVSSVVNGLLKELNITVNVCLHLDHGKSFESCKKAIDNGFTSVMIDASSFPIEKNIKITKEVVEYAAKRGVTVEAEVGHIGGTEDNVTSGISNATLEDCLILWEKTGVDSLAPALGSVHGIYKGEPNLDFETMKLINKKLPIPLVLHGGTGIPDEKIRKAISCGISKININTELQLAWANALKKYLDKNKNVYDPRKIISSGELELKKVVCDKLKIFSNI